MLKHDYLKDLQHDGSQLAREKQQRRGDTKAAADQYCSDVTAMVETWVKCFKQIAKPYKRPVSRRTKIKDPDNLMRKTRDITQLFDGELKATMEEPKGSENVQMSAFSNDATWRAQCASIKAGIEGNWMPELPDYEPCLLRPAWPEDFVTNGLNLEFTEV